MSAWQLEIIEQVAHLSLARPEHENALTRAMWQALPALLDKITQVNAQVLVLHAQGKAFSVGSDAQELLQRMDDRDWILGQRNDTQAALKALHELRFPTIAVLQGAVFGDGLGLASACDFRLARNDTCFALPTSNAGTSWSMQDCQRILQLVGPARTRELMFTGAPWPAYQALTYGLVHEVHAPNTLEAAWVSLVEKLSRNAGITEMKKALLEMTSCETNSGPSNPKAARFD